MSTALLALAIVLMAAALIFITRADPTSHGIVRYELTIVGLCVCALLAALARGLLL